jgi:hypothetical protein
MIFEDPRWTSLLGGYRTLYDPRPTLTELVRFPSSGQLWIALWEELHHQGDVGDASYAALPTFAEVAALEHADDWNPYALAAVIEEARHSERNAPLPEWLADDYRAAWESLFESALCVMRRTKSKDVIESALAVIAIYKGQRTLGRIAMLTEDERNEMLKAIGLG